VRPRFWPSHSANPPPDRRARPSHPSPSRSAVRCPPPPWVLA
jgi:hypothetical protein